MRDLFTLGDEYANATETSEIFASVNGEVTATLAAEQAPLPELNHAEGALSFPTHHQSNQQWQYTCFPAQGQRRPRRQNPVQNILSCCFFQLGAVCYMLEALCSVLDAAFGAACCVPSTSIMTATGCNVGGMHRHVE